MRRCHPIELEVHSVDARLPLRRPPAAARKDEGRGGIANARHRRTRFFARGRWKRGA